MDRAILAEMNQEERLRFFLKVLEEIGRRRDAMRLARRKAVVCPYCNQETEPNSRWHERGDCFVSEEFAKGVAPKSYQHLQCTKCKWHGLAADVVGDRCPACSCPVAPKVKRCPES